MRANFGATSFVFDLEEALFDEQSHQEEDITKRY